MHASLDLHPLAAVIQSVRELLAKDWLVRVARTLREGNFCADSFFFFFAKMGVKQEACLVILDARPSGIKSYIFVALMMVAFPRV